MGKSALSAADTGAAVATSVVIAISGRSRSKFLMTSSLLMRLSCFLPWMGQLQRTHRSIGERFADLPPPPCYDDFSALRLPCNGRRRPRRQRFRIDLDDAAADAH